MQIGGDQVGDELCKEWAPCEEPQIEEHLVELHPVEVSQPGEAIQEELLGMVTHLEDKYPKRPQVGICRGICHHKILSVETLLIQEAQEAQGDQKDLEDPDHQDQVAHQWEAFLQVEVEVQILQLLLFLIDLFRSKKNKPQIRKTPNSLLSFSLTNLMEQS